MHPLITETVAADITAERREFAARARRFPRPRRVWSRAAHHLAPAPKPQVTGAHR